MPLLSTAPAPATERVSHVVVRDSSGAVVVEASGDWPGPLSIEQE